MDKFPFTKREWRAVTKAAQNLAEGASVPSQRNARFAELKAILNELRDKHGDHPALLEIEADFAAEPGTAVALYRAAELYATANGFPTLSIRLSLARVLLQEVEQPAAARAVLRACETELADARAQDCEAWSGMLAECERLAPAERSEPRPSPAARLQTLAGPKTA